MDRIALDNLTEKLIAHLRKSPSDLYTVNSLAEIFKKNVEDIVAGLKQAESWGYEFSYSDPYIVFLKAPDLLTGTEITNNLKTGFIGHTVLSYRQVKSTNDLARERAEAGAPEGTIIVAEEQLQGRGRLGRSWHSPAGKGVYLSIILRPSFPPANAPGVSLMTALALADSLSVYCPGMVSIKWPNDVLINGRKVAGILTELAADQSKIHHILVGAGININQSEDEFPSEIRHLATSINIACGQPVKRVEVLQRFLVEFEKRYLEYTQSGLGKSLKQLRCYSSLLGRKVKLKSGQKIIEGTAVDISAIGALIIEHDGSISEISCGEVTVVKD